MKFKAKETSKSDSFDTTWIIKDRIYDLKERFDGSYIFKSEISDNHTVDKANLSKWFEAVEEVKKPRICEILGVEVNEEFRLKTTNGNTLLDKKYHITENGTFFSENDYPSPSIAIDLINGGFEIVKLPKWTEEEQEILKALKVLGFGWIARDKMNILYTFNSIPKKHSMVWGKTASDDMIKLNEELFSFVQWEDKEPFEIPNIQ